MSIDEKDKAGRGFDAVPAAVVLSVLAAAITLYFLWLTLLAGYADIPIQDQLYYLTPEAILHLWKHHNGAHLIVFPRLIYWADDRFFAGTNQFNIAVFLLIQALQAALFVLIARDLGYRSKSAIAVVSAMAVVLAFATCQHQSFTWGWEVQWGLVNTGFAAAAYALSRYAVTGKAPWLALAAFGGVVSTWSMGSGLAALPLLVALALAYRRPRAALLLLLTALFAIGVYWVGRERVMGEGHLEGVAHTIAYGLALLGNPLTHTFISQSEAPAGLQPPNLVIHAVWIGAATAAVTAPALVLVFVRLRPQGGHTRLSWSRVSQNILTGDFTDAPDADSESEYASLALVALILFALAAIVFTTYGRSWAGVQQALADRYATSTIPLVMSVTLLLGRPWRNDGESDRVRGVAAVLLSLGLVAFAWRGGSEMGEVLAQRNANERSMMALAVDIHDHSQLPMAFPPRGDALTAVMKGFARLSASHRSLFSEPWVQAMGQPLSRAAPLGIGGQCEGALTPAPDEPGAGAASPPPSRLIRGVVWAPPSQHPTPTILLAGDDGQVVGVGRVEVTIADVKGGGIRTNRKPIPWRAALRREYLGRTSAYLLIEGGRRACLIASSAAAPS